MPLSICAAKADTLTSAFAQRGTAGECSSPASLRKSAYLWSSTDAPQELTLFNVRRSNHESHAALEMLMRHASLFRPMLTHTRPLERVQEGFELLESYSDGVGKLLIEV